MSANEQKPTIQEDEIDLKELFNTLKRQKNTVFVVTFACVIAAACYLALAKPVYTQTLLIRVPQINTNTNTIASITHSLLTYRAQTEKEFDLTTKAPANVLEIVIKSSTVETLVNEQKKIIDFLANHPQIKPLVDETNRSMAAMINQVDERIHKNKQIKEHIDQQILSGKELTIGFNPINMESEMLELAEKRLSYTQIQQNIGKFEIINDPTLPTKPSSPKTMLIMAVSLVTGLILGIFGAFGREFFSTKTEE